MSKNDVLITLIKEVVKNEVKRQVKEEVAKLIKSGAVSLNTDKKSASLMELTTPTKTEKLVKDSAQSKNNKEKKIFTKNSAINEILNMTQPFTSAQRAEGSTMMGGSVLDSIKRESEEDWGTINTNALYTNRVTESNVEGADAVTKALTRDYSELVKRSK